MTLKIVAMDESYIGKRLMFKNIKKMLKSKILVVHATSIDYLDGDYKKNGLDVGIVYITESNPPKRVFPEYIKDAYRCLFQKTIVKAKEHKMEINEFSVCNFLRKCVDEVLPEYVAQKVVFNSGSVKKIADWQAGVYLRKVKKQLENRSEKGKLDLEYLRTRGFKITPRFEDELYSMSLT